MDVFSSHGRVLTTSLVRILVAENEPSLCRLIVAALTADGYEVDRVADLGELLQTLPHWFPGLGSGCSYGLMIADLNTPGFQGIDVLTAVRRLSSAIPVVVVTEGGRCASPEVDKLGARAVVAKPFDFDDLRTIVLNLVSDTDTHRSKQSLPSADHWLRQ